VRPLSGAAAGMSGCCEWLGLLWLIWAMAAVWHRIAARWLRAAVPLKVRLNMMVIEDVAARLSPGKESDPDAQNAASFAVSDSTYGLIDELSKAVEADVRAAKDHPRQHG